MLCLTVFTACETNDVPSGSHYLVATSKAPFYKFGPAQSFGPDFVLNEGAKVTMLEHSFGFSRVMTEDGTAGFMSTEDQARAARPVHDFDQGQDQLHHPTQPTNVRAAAIRREAQQCAAHARHRSPLFDTSDTPLPPSTATPKPGFHF
ncbi:MAG: hypothetical protein WDN28_28320 [Chthoniobacter sp.]